MDDAASKECCPEVVEVVERDANIFARYEIIGSVWVGAFVDYHAVVVRMRFRYDSDWYAGHPWEKLGAEGFRKSPGRHFRVALRPHELAVFFFLEQPI